MSGLTEYERNRYERHLKIPDLGEIGQLRLKNASALVVGVGGLGSASALYLAAAGIGRLGIVDSDQVELSNLQRQILHGEADLGKWKVTSAEQRLIGLRSDLKIEPYAQAFTQTNAMKLIMAYDMVIDGTDNFAARYLINEACFKSGKPFVYGAVSGFEGQVSVFDPKVGACYRCLFPNTPSSADFEKPGVVSPMPGVIGCLQALEVIKIIVGIGESLVGYLLVCNLMDSQFLKIKVQKRKNCPTCGIFEDKPGK